MDKGEQLQQFREGMVGINKICGDIAVLLEKEITDDTVVKVPDGIEIVSYNSYLGITNNKGQVLLGHKDVPYRIIPRSLCSFVPPCKYSAITRAELNGGELIFNFKPHAKDAFCNYGIISSLEVMSGWVAMQCFEWGKDGTTRLSEIQDCIYKVEPL